MLAGNLAFVSGPWLRSLVTGRQQPAGRVLYDGACPRCRASMALLSAGDPDHVIEPVDLTAVDVTTIHPSLSKEACLRSMHVVRADGKVIAGYDAVVLLGRWLPLFWLPAVLGSLPGVTALGRRAYNALAASRRATCLVPTRRAASIPPTARAGRSRSRPGPTQGDRTDERATRHPRPARRRPASPPPLSARPGLEGRPQNRQRAEFCYMMAPGQDYYHRLGDGELFVYNNSDERLASPAPSAGGSSTTTRRSCAR